MSTLTRGQVAKESGVNIETLRYYEKRRLIPKPSRSSAGYRLYTTKTISRILFIKSAQELGFTLKEIAQLLALRVKSKSTCGDVKRKAEEKIRDIDEKIKSLRSMKKALNKLKAACDSSAPITECHILEVLEYK